MFHYQQNFYPLSAGPVTNYQQEQEDSDVARPTKKRLEETHSIVESLYAATLRLRPGEKATVRKSQRRNRNEVYALANAILVKEIHLNGLKYSRDIELTKGIHTNINRNEFLLVLRTDGRIVVMSEEAERHLGKSMRSLYAQCINMFDCLNDTDRKKLRTVLNSSAADQGQEHRLICTFRLPKGKRPSRVREDIKTMTMAGHFYSCQDPSSSSSSSSSYEKLFVARCEALVSRTTANGSSSSQSESSYVNTNSSTMLEITLNDDMSINAVSSNVEEILGYRRQELMNIWFGRFIPTEDLQQFEINRQKSYQQEQSEQKLPTSICDIFDIYSKDGEGRLTFLYQIRPIRTRKTRALRFQITMQLIDPTFRNEYVKHLQSESDSKKKNNKAAQVNLVSSSVSKTYEDGLLANSPSLTRGLLVCESISNCEFTAPQHSPISRSLSDVVGPVTVTEQYWSNDLFSFEHEQYPIEINFPFEPTMDYSNQCQTSTDLTSNFYNFVDSSLIDDDFWF